MNIQKSLVAIALAGIIAGCGSDDNDNNSNTMVPTFNVRVIDGYLAYAEVYVDRNGDNVADSDEKLAQLTDKDGYIQIPESDKKYKVIARAIAGKTQDSDLVYPVKNAFELTAPAGATVVNPYTTLAVMENKSIEDFAAEHNLDSALIAGDYVQAKKENPAAAKKAHLIARSLTLTLKENIAQSTDSVGEIKTELEEIKNQVAELENNQSITDFDEIIIENGKVTETAETSQSLFSGNTYASAEFSLPEYKEKGIQKITFADTEATYTNRNGTSAALAIEYTEKGFNVTDENDSSADRILFFGNDFYLLAEDEMYLLANERYQAFENQKFPTKNIENNQFAGKTFYAVWDDGDNGQPIPTLGKLTFQAQTVTLEEYDINSGFKPFAKSIPWKTAEDTLFVGQGKESFNWAFTTLAHSGLQVVYNVTDVNEVAVFTEDQDLAMRLYKQWVKK